jgi:hypothetical protein
MADEETLQKVREAFDIVQRDGDGAARRHSTVKGTAPPRPREHFSRR